MANKKIIKKNDIILILILLCLAGILYIAIDKTKKDGRMVQITIDGSLVKELSLSEDTTYKISDEKGEKVIVVDGDTVYITYSNCPNQICVNHAPISKSKETIICLPHKLIVEIK